jgi:hypothetical protein
MKNYKDLLEEYKSLDVVKKPSEIARKSVVKELIKYKAARASLVRIYKAKGMSVDEIVKELDISEADIEYFNTHEVSFEMQREEAKNNVAGDKFETLVQLRDLLDVLRYKQNPVMKPEHSKTYIIHLQLYNIFQTVNANYIYFTSKGKFDGSYMLVFSKETLCNVWAFYDDTKLKFVVEYF